MDKKPANKKKQLKETEHRFIIPTRLDKVFKGTIVNQALPSLHGGSQLKLRLQSLKGF